MCAVVACEELLELVEKFVKFPPHLAMVRWRASSVLFSEHPDSLEPGKGLGQRMLAPCPFVRMSAQPWQAGGLCTTPAHTSESQCMHEGGLFYPSTPC